MAFQRSEAFALGGLLLALQGSNVQMRRPSWNRPTFWSRCLAKQIARPVAAGTAMTTLLTVEGLPNYVAVVDRIVMTVVGPTAGTGIRFQALIDGGLVPNTQYPADIELNKEGPTTYPVESRSWYLPVLQTQELELQVENLGGLQRTVLMAAYGWYYATVDATSVAADNGVTDGAYPPLAGGPTP